MYTRTRILCMQSGYTSSFVAITSRVARRQLLTTLASDRPCTHGAAGKKKKKKNGSSIPHSEMPRCVYVARATGCPLATAAVLTRRRRASVCRERFFFCVVASCSGPPSVPMALQRSPESGGYRRKTIPYRLPRSRARTRRQRLRLPAR